MDGRQRKLEEQYFDAHNARLRKKMREEAERWAAEERHREKLAEASGTADPEMLDRLRGLGLDSDLGKVLPLLPLVAVAWADNSVTSAERTAVMAIAESRGIAPDSKAATFLASLLETRPSQEFREVMVEILRHIVRTEGTSPKSLIEACETIAAASGGFLGLGVFNTISPEERAEIERISAAVGGDATGMVTSALE